jgi:glycosyltransferase involved in cell wall biosynthesis
MSLKLAEERLPNATADFADTVCTEARSELSIVLPCLNEAETLEVCVKKAQQALSESHIDGEIIVADNGSTDGSQAIATRMGTRLVEVKERGYGSALMAGIRAARGKYIIMGDADDSYDFAHLPLFLEKLQQGFDLVMGNRFKGGIKPGAMPSLHKYLGNPVLTRVGRLFFGSVCGDFHCGMRGFTKDAFLRCGLRTTGMEFASEMVVKATLFKMRITEVPTTLSPDGRSRRPHLRTWRDGWRHLRFMLLYSPRWLFLYPGALLMLAGLLLVLWLLPGPRTIGNVTFDVHTLLYGTAAVLIGFQAIAFAVFTKVFAITEGLLPRDARLDKMFRIITLEIGLIVGGLCTVGGLAASVYALKFWGSRGFGPLEVMHTMRTVVPAAASMILGFQIVLSSFFLSVLGLARDSRPSSESSSSDSSTVGQSK